jgi:hypothetical protein
MPLMYMFLSISLIQQILSSGASSGGGRFLTSNGNPVEVYISEAGGRDMGGLLSALGGGAGSGFAFPLVGGEGGGIGLSSNIGDYAFGNIQNIINQLMQNDPNRVRQTNSFMRTKRLTKKYVSYK